ncbi:MAG: hypothetical protein ACD_42C00521G0002 [uncultured bacterium]|nr:MAG: hypothetical protein ACD_42C00521G0002 [uncultured bacterium]OGT34548.1 MAG: hypothetical protein A3C44_08105 [Gammaproteobacteria bacterium RIFCSPHIGHO2_02_FULL_39_13]OGT50571.1 MAG: hypothetical protein A3E53_03520 [Gammaproteobacteria bacterium RIFCSPHIGHO2_12_FULL_39_24]
MKTTKKSASGFFIVEILIVLVIIGILVVALLPNLQTYTKRAQFQDVVAGASAVRSAVDLCIVRVASVGATTVPASCVAGSNGIPANNAAIDTGFLGSVTTAANGVITATSYSTNFGGAYTYILTPALSASGFVTWTPSGTCQAAGYC